MRKVSKLILVFIICNFILANFSGLIFALEDADKSLLTFDKSEYDSLAGTGTTTVETENGSITKKIGKTESSVGSGTGKITSTMVPWVAGLDAWLCEVVVDGGLKYAYLDSGKVTTDSKYGVDKNGLLTMYSMAFGEFLLLDGNIFKVNQSLNPAVTTTQTVELADKMKSAVAACFNIAKYFALLVSVPIFVYALIKALTATESRDLAAWKKVLGRWLVALILLFTLQYILSAILSFNDILMDVMWKTRLTLEEDGHSGIELELFNKSASGILNTGGNLSLAYGIEYIMMSFLQILFLVKYVVRMFTLMLLTAIGPLIIVVHAFKIMIGKESSTLKAWLKKYAALTYIQPIHALLYLIFMFTASEIVVQIPVLGIAMMYALYRGESIAKSMLNLEEGTSIL